MEKEFIIILDFLNGEVYTSEYDSNVYEDGEEFIGRFSDVNDLDISISNCQWMVTKGNLKITQF